ncbi:helix-turn-helix transcriptional regulator [Paenibacillus sp. KACC 21273]|uniref:helix-turn-helix domain-containing protein n=1 Tax=Paenibacillus sp. KACC 21273 TaxID=3025665 RepID=UPI0023672360|nr:helix-turn-helix transcriptional regulator [Paenibacillus sp. KACC 21273]WDF52460.1 helix-turn-helix transcriptional regulator [Paenibacillus sp. KACC 21273]
MKIIKINLKSLLKKYNLTQKQLEALSGVSQSRISKLCRDDRQEVNLLMLSKIANAMDITDISELLDFADEE